ncbi:MAG: sigma-70 family RNA polymerase sigma factor [Akkermansiaceae bacterium]|nr:sigma-70 family RNA polymerase sigma factor [Armatimonadota bacterium]
MSTIPVKTTERLSLFFWKPRAAVAPLSATELQRRYLSTVFHYVSARIQGGTEAEDITADVFSSAFAALHSLPKRAATGDDDPVRAWLFGIARRKVADAYRRRTRRPEEELQANMPAPPHDAPESQVLADEAAMTLQSILDALPEMQREALRLKYVEELSGEEMGWVLGKSPNAVGQLLHRARQAVRVRGADYFGDLSESKETTR